MQMQSLFKKTEHLQSNLFAQEETKEYDMTCERSLLTKEMKDKDVWPEIKGYL